MRLWHKRNKLRHNLNIIQRRRPWFIFYSLIDNYRTDIFVTINRVSFLFGFGVVCARKFNIKTYPQQVVSVYLCEGIELARYSEHNDLYTHTTLLCPLSISQALQQTLASQKYVYFVQAYSSKLTHTKLL